MVTSSRSHNAGRSPASCRGILAWAFMGDVTGAGATWNGHYGRHRMGGRAPCRRALTSGTRGEEPALLLPPSLAAAGEPHPLPMERTSLTGSVVSLCVHDSIGTHLLRGE